jgi:queuine tRNA-ribosyltransferase
VLPTRSGRNGQAFTKRGPVNLRNARHAEDPRPLEASCRCPACRQYSRAYLHHLVKSDEILASMLITWHNLTHYQDLTADLREAIQQKRLADHAASLLKQYASGDIDPN